MTKNKKPFKYIILIFLYICLTPCQSWADIYTKLIDEGINKFKENNIEEASKSFSEAANLKPDRYEAYYWRSKCYLSNNKLKKRLNDLTICSNIEINIAQGTHSDIIIRNKSITFNGFIFKNGNRVPLIIKINYKNINIPLPHKNEGILNYYEY
jgi:hypothetical protein